MLDLIIENDNKTTEISTISKMTIEPDNKTNEIHTIHKLAIKKK